MCDFSNKQLLLLSDLFKKSRGDSKSPRDQAHENRPMQTSHRPAIALLI